MTRWTILSFIVYILYGLKFSFAFVQSQLKFDSSSLTGPQVQSSRLGVQSSNIQSVLPSNLVAESKNVNGIFDGLKVRRMPNSDLLVTEVALGTMNFGDQLNEEQSMNLLDAAVNEFGINLLDTSEAYPAPFAESTCGASEKIIGRWLKQSKKRKDVILSSSICGYSDFNWIKRKNSNFTCASKEQITEAVDAQLERLGTDYIDLLQIQWPDRYVPLYGALEYKYESERKFTPIREQIEAIDSLIKAGKVRYYGLSNETPYGVGLWSSTAEFYGLPRPISTQHEYNLLTRRDFETKMMEACSPVHANLGLLAYSPLGGGSLTGKYADPFKIRPNFRLRQYVGFMHRYLTKPAKAAIESYLKVADHYSVPLGLLALAFVYSRKFVSSTIIGVSSKAQLRENMLALNIPVDTELQAALDEVYMSHPDPTKGVFEVEDPNYDEIDPSKLPWGAQDTDLDPELDALINQRLKNK